MAVLIVEGRIHQFVTTYSQVRLCYVTSLATASSISIIFCFNHAKCFNLSKHKWRCSTTHICDSTALCPFNQYDCVTQDRGSTDRLSTYNYLTWLSLSEKTINVLCHSSRLMCIQWRGLNQLIQMQGKGGAT